MFVYNLFFRTPRMLSCSSRHGSGQSLMNTFPAFIFSSGNRKRAVNALLIPDWSFSLRSAPPLFSPMHKKNLQLRQICPPWRRLFSPPPSSHHAFLFLLNPQQLLSLSGLQPRASRAFHKPHKERNKQREQRWNQQRLCGFNLALSSSDAPKGNNTKKMQEKT